MAVAAFLDAGIPQRKRPNKFHGCTGKGNEGIGTSSMSLNVKNGSKSHMHSRYLELGGCPTGCEPLSLAEPTYIP